MKRTVLSLSLALMATAGAWAYDFKAGDLYYNIYHETEKTVKVTYEKYLKTDNYSSLSGELTIPATVTYDDVEYTVIGIGSHAFRYSPIAQVTLPESVTSIGYCAFADCDALTQVDMGSKVETIERAAFAYCDALPQMNIPASVTSIDDFVFEDCKALTEIKVDEANTAYCSENGVLFTKDKTTLMQYPAAKQGTTYVVPGSVTSIKGAAFAYCAALTQVTLPEGLPSIEKSLFHSCTGLTQITIPNSVTSIGDYAFYSCDGLTQITIPNNVTSIGNYAFYYCKVLACVTIGSGVTSIGDYAFSYCKKLKKMIVQAAEPPAVASDAFNGRVSPDIPVYVPAGSLEAYQAADVWKDFQLQALQTDYTVDYYVEGSGVCFSNRIAMCGTFQCYVRPADGHSILSVTLDGEDITDRLGEDGLLEIAALTENHTIVISTNQPSKVAGAQQDAAAFRAWQSNGELFVEHTQDMTGVALYDANGRLLSQTATSGYGVLRMAVADTIHIVRVIYADGNTASMKVR